MNTPCTLGVTRLWASVDGEKRPETRRASLPSAPCRNLACGLCAAAFLLPVVMWVPLARAQQTLRPVANRDNHLVYVPIPPDVSKEELLAPSEPLKARLHSLVRQHPALQKRLLREAPDFDLIIVFTDDSGLPILPDLEAVRERRGKTRGLTALTTAANELSFTFNSPTYPWTAGELTALNAALNDFYPTAKAVYGNPAFNITVNVRQDPTISFAGLYYVSLNEMVLHSASLDPICHEMIHAFRDDDIIALSSFEEGMTRAAEVEVFNRLPAYPHWDKNHSYTYDAYYEGLNRQKIGSRNGNLFAGYVSALLRYQLAGYAWAKAFLENSNFFSDFNRDLYARILVDPTTNFTESRLLDIAAAAQPTVEAEPFLTWYGQQGVFNTNPTHGYLLYQRMNQFTVDYFFRSPWGSETMQANATIDWAVYDYLGTLVDSGSGLTSAFGLIFFSPTFSAGYTGRIEVVAATMSPSGPITESTLAFRGSEVGVFGITFPADSGSITITPLDDPTPPVSLTVVNGGFSAPSLATARGRFIATFTDTGGQSVSKHFTKDASNYFLLMHAAPANDACEESAVIAAVPFQDTLDTSKATTLASDPVQSCTGSQNSNSVWYSFTPRSSGTVVSSAVGSDYNTVLTAYTGTCGALTEVACSDDASGLSSQFSFTATAGTTYSLEVTGLGAGGGSLHLSLTGIAGCLLDVDRKSPCCDVATDVVYVARHLLGLMPVPPDFRGLDPTIPSDAGIAAATDAIHPSLDVDMNGVAEVATDIVYIARYLVGLTPVPPDFRDLDPTIPPDAAIAAKVDALCTAP